MSPKRTISASGEPSSKRRYNIMTEKFVELWGDVIKLVVNGEADARDALDDVVSSNLGIGMYSFAIAATLDLKVTNAIQASLQSMFDASELLSRATLDQLILAICQKFDALSVVTLLQQRRTVKVMYRGQEFERQVKSIPQQVGLEVAACW